MAWFGEGLSSLSNLKGQITSFTKDVLSEGIIEEIGNEANDRCIQLQELLTAKDAEISLLRRQNCELQKTVVELNAKSKDLIDVKQQDEECDGFFWDPLSVKNRNPKNSARQLQEQLSQATLRIRELETELKRLQKVNTTSVKDEINDGHQSAEFHRAKQDMMNRIIQIEEKTRESERNAKRVQLDELTIINDFRTVISKLESSEKLNLVRGVLKALEIENEKDNSLKEEKSNFDEKFRKISVNYSESASLKPSDSCNADMVSQSDEIIDLSQNRETELYKKIEELNQENKNLFANIEELDRQHAESIEELLSLKEDLEKKHHCLQNAYEQLYVDYNEAEAKAKDLQNKLKSGITNKVISLTASHFVQTEIVQSVDNGVQTNLATDNENHSSLDNSHLAKLEHKIKDILKNTCIDAEPGESIFESVAKKYVDAKWKQDVLERKLTETTRDMKDIIKLKDSLQMECDDMQSHIDSLLIEIQRLKQNLPSIPEACEERVASLETETETLHEDIKRLEAENDELWKKNAELTIAIRDFEMAFRDQDGLEPEIRNMTEQVDFMANPVERSKSVETEESSDENIDKRKSNLLSLNEDTGLQESTNYTESSENQLREELRIISEKYEALGKHIESSKNVNEDLEQSKKMINDLLSTIKTLEENVGTLESSRTELDRNNDILLHKNQELLAELNRSRDTASHSEESNLIKELQIKLDTCNREKEDRGCDILHMSNELDTALNQIEEKHEQMRLLGKTNEDLIKQNAVLTDQLSAVKKEFLEEITRLRMEKSILEEEQTEAKQEIFNNHEELIKLKEKVHEMEEQCHNLRQELFTLKSRPDELRTENERLSGEIKQVNDQLTRNEATEQKLIAMQHMHEEVENEYRKLQEEFSALYLKFQKMQKENDELQNTELQFKSVTEELNLIQRKNKEMEIALEELEKYKLDIKTLEEQLHLERSSVKTLQTENSKLKALLNEHMSCSSKMECLTSAINEKTEENHALRAENEKLITDIAQNEIKLKTAIEHNQEVVATKETIEKLSDLIKQKDEEIEVLNSSVRNKDIVDADHLKNLSAIQNERDELLKYVQIKHAESLQYHAEIQRLSQLLNEQSSHIQSLITEQTANQTALKEKNTELLSTQDELQSIQQRLKEVEESNDSNQICRVIAHTEQQREISILNEKCNAMEAALVQEQLSNRMLQNQLSESQNKEAISVKELERLRAHLVEMESTYTEEAVIAEENRKELEAKLLQAEEKMKNSSTVYTSASIRANQQVETLQQQIALIVQQRDDIQHKLSLAEDKILTQTASLTNLQLVLEQFQRDKEKDIIMATEKLQNRLQESYKSQEKLVNEISDLKDQLADAKECLQAASRLSEQLDRKTERIEFLNQEVKRLTELVNSSDQRVQILRQTEDSKVDKTLVKNLLLGYLSSTTTDKPSVLRVVATVLDFNEQEREKAGLDASGNTGWFARLSGGNSTVPTKDQETSLSAAFVRFLESESKPKPQLPALPISNSPLSKPSHSRQHSTSSTNQSTLLLSNVSLPTFPDFIPARNTGSILKEVLKDS